MTSSSGHVIALDQSEASIWAKRAQLTTMTEYLWYFQKLFMIEIDDIQDHYGEVTKQKSSLE